MNESSDSPPTNKETANDESTNNDSVEAVLKEAVLKEAVSKDSKPPPVRQEQGEGSRRSARGRDLGASTDDRDGDEDGSEDRAFASAAIHGPGYWADQLSKGIVSEQATNELAEDVRKRAGIAGSKLMMHLTGGITVELERSGGKLQFDWRSSSSSANLSSGSASGSGTSGSTSITPDQCNIRISDENLMRIASGDLNPQLAMLSDKIRVDGKHSLAMYFFNLVAPRVRGL